MLLLPGLMTLIQLKCSDASGQKSALRTGFRGQAADIRVEVKMRRREEGSSWRKANVLVLEEVALSVKPKRYRSRLAGRQHGEWHAACSEGTT
jgi:hypothetical protein